MLAHRSEKQLLTTEAEPEAERLPPWRQPIPLLGRNVDTSRRDLPNAPKRQTCRSCGKWVKRTRKTLGLASYRCNRCKVDTIVKLRGYEVRRR